MARVLFVNAGSEGHINPTLGVVQELIRRGEEVVYFTGDSMRERVTETGAKVISCDARKLLEAFLAGGRHPWARVSGLLRTADVIIPSILEQTKGQHFDYLIHDSMFGCGRLVAQVLNLPAVNSCTSFGFQESNFDALQDSRLQQFTGETNEQQKAEFKQLVSHVEERYHVEVGSPYDVFFNPAPLTIVYTSRNFQPAGDSFDESYKFVGPSITPRSHGGEELGSLDLNTDNLIYISLGTVFNEAGNFYKLCFEAFANTPYTVILSVGGRTQLDSLGEIPANFIVRNYVPQLEVLQHAKLFITHGGMNSTSEGLYYGVPLIVIPQSADQPMIARRIAELGAGMQLELEGLSAMELREAAQRTTSDASLKQACIDLGNSFRAAGGFQRAVDEIFAYKGRLGINA